MMGFGAGNKDAEKHTHEVADIPPSLSDLHCFTETEGVITTSTSRLPQLPARLPQLSPARPPARTH